MVSVHTSRDRRLKIRLSRVGVEAELRATCRAARVGNISGRVIHAMTAE